ncbi:MAG: organic hydroperoxide resistance protein [Candidatus Nanopelagicales bacterium]
MKPLYTAHATATGEGRNGHTATDDGLLDVDVRIPVEMGGPGGATNPEQLFAAGYAACFHSALKVVAGGTDLSDSQVSSDVAIGRLASGGFGLAVALTVSIPGLDRDAAEALVAKAHEVCPYSNAIRGNVDVDLKVA